MTGRDWSSPKISLLMAFRARSKRSFEDGRDCYDAQKNAASLEHNHYSIFFRSAHNKTTKMDISEKRVQYHMYYIGIVKEREVFVDLTLLCVQ